MIYISHRGNLNGKDVRLENTVDYIDKALYAGFDAEIDLWYINDTLWLGHDEPNNQIDIFWIQSRSKKLWIHCKNYEAILYLINYPNSQSLNFFWHQNDLLTLTSKNYIWVYPGNQPIKGSIAVLPELFSDPLADCLGVCSDYIKKIRDDNISY